MRSSVLIAPANAIVMSGQWTERSSRIAGRGIAGADPRLSDRRSGRARRMLAAEMSIKFDDCPARTVAVVGGVYSANGVSAANRVPVERLNACSRSTGPTREIGRAAGISFGLARRARVFRRLGSTGAFLAGSERGKGARAKEEGRAKMAQGERPYPKRAGRVRSARGTRATECG